MSSLKLEINLKKLQENAKKEVETLREHGMTIMGVNKVFNGMLETAQALINAGIDTIAEARISALKKLQGLPVRKCLLRSPSLSEVAEAVAYADISLCSELEIITALAHQAAKQQRTHHILLMIDMGDLREGIWFTNEEAIEQSLSLIVASAPWLKLYGVGTNFSCFGGIVPTRDHLMLFTKLVDRMETRLNLSIPLRSGGNCTTFHLIDKGLWSKDLRINHLRIGGLHQFGIEYVEMKYLAGYHHSAQLAKFGVSNLYRLHAEIIEIHNRPTYPFGELGGDAFLERKNFTDRGVRKQALLAFGRFDVSIQNCLPCDSTVKILGQTSDHTIIDIEDCHPDKYKLGCKVLFELDYTALLSLCRSESLETIYI